MSAPRLTIVYEVHSIGQRAALLHATDHVAISDGDAISQRDELLQALKNTRAALLYQIEGKHGPKVASEYPEIVEAKAAIARIEGGKL